MSDPSSLVTQGAQLSLRRTLKSAAVVNTDVTVYDSQEFIGGQHFWVTFDTGSSDLWVVSVDCEDADCQGITRYSRAVSQTLNLSDKPFELTYLRGSVQGNVGTETITLGAYQISSQTFALANHTNGLDLTNAGNSGILGLSFLAAAAIQPTWGTTLLDNLFGHFDQSNRFFAFKLGRNGTKEDARTYSSFTIGRLDSAVTNDTSQMTFFPVFGTKDSPYDYWKLTIQKIMINGLAVPLSRSLVLGAESPIGVLDTGTTLMLGPTADVEAFWTMIGVGGSARYNEQLQSWEVLCNRVVDVRIEVGDAGNTKEYALHPEDISWAERRERDGWCLGGVQANDRVDSGDWLLGDVFLRNVYVVHQGATSSRPPVIGLMSMTDPNSSISEFTNVRGPDFAPAPSAPSRSYSNQSDADVEAASAVCAIAGFLLGGLGTVFYWVKKGSRRATARL
ncbi:aspartic peptidase domain-containing protein [Phlebopus sp. FC_14]|nr:aspartic peptidase domain-containing protein [Phlebopus sp. FC_14]